MSNQDNKLAVVPGGTGGIGSQVVRMFLKNDTKVLVPTTGMKDNNLPNHRHLTVKLCDYLEDKTVKQLAAKHQAPHFLVYCAGSFIGHKKVADLTDGDVMEKFESNIRGLWHFIRHFVPEMRELEKANVIGISSLAAEKRKPYLGLSSWAKVGTEIILQTLDNEESASGISANIIVPSIVDTEKEREVFSDDNPEFWMEDKSVADIVEFLCLNSAAKYIHGSRIKCYQPNPKKIKNREESLRSRGVDIE